MAIASQLDLHPDLADQALGETSPLPSWSYLRDLKDQYDVSTVLYAAGYFSVLHLKKTPQELLQRIYELSQEALDAFYKKYEHLQDQAGQDHMIARPRVITYQELEERCQAIEGYQAFREASNQKRNTIFVMGPATRALQSSKSSDS